MNRSIKGKKTALPILNFDIEIRLYSQSKYNFRMQIDFELKKDCIHLN